MASILLTGELVKYSVCRISTVFPAGIYDITSAAPHPFAIPSVLNV